MAGVMLEGITKRFGDTVAVDGIDMEIPDQALTVLVGPSGCGKSTLLRIIAGLEDVDGGEVRIGGRRVNELAPARRDIAMVFQSYALYPHMTVFDNIAFPLRMARLDRTTIEQKVHEAAELLRLGALLPRKPRALSGGQQQRVAIGRAMVRDPAVYLFDEPLSNLDAQLRIELRDEIAGLQRAIGATMVYVTHDQVEAMALADRIVALNDGRVEQTGAPMDLYNRPANRFVAGFIGAPGMNFLDATVADVGADGARVVLPGGASLHLAIDPGAIGPGAAVTLGIRPEHIAFDGALLEATAVRIDALGAQTHVHLDTEAGPLLAVVSDDRIPGEGDKLRIGLPPERCHLFDTNGRALRR